LLARILSHNRSGLLLRVVFSLLLVLILCARAKHLRRLRNAAASSGRCHVGIRGIVTILVDRTLRTCRLRRLMATRYAEDQSQPKPHAHKSPARRCQSSLLLRATRPSCLHSTRMRVIHHTVCCLPVADPVHVVSVPLQKGSRSIRPSAELPRVPVSLDAFRR